MRSRPGFFAQRCLRAKGVAISSGMRSIRGGNKAIHSSWERFARWLLKKSMAPKFALRAALLVFCALLLLTEVLLHFRTAEADAARRAMLQAHVSELRARVDRELNSVLFLAGGVAGYLVVRDEKINPEEFNNILAAVYSNNGPYIRNFTIAVAYQISYVYPLAGNERALGRDYRDLSTQWPYVKRAVETRQAVLSGPVSLVQGGTALIHRSPVFHKDAYWGLISTVIDLPSFQDAVFKKLEDERFEFAIRAEDVGGGGMLWGRPELFSRDAVLRVEADVPGATWEYAVRARQQDGGVLTWVDRAMGLLLAAVVAYCVNRVLRQRNELARHAGYDMLTDLPNRRLFDDRMEQAIRRHARRGRGQVAVVFMDLDGFKQVNDLYGHKYGDFVLRVVASRIRSEVRIGDTVARWAGDEFAVIIEEADEIYVGQLVQRLRHAIVDPFDVDGLTLSVSASIGTAFFPKEAASAVALLELADRRMFEGKGSGRPDPAA